MKLWPLINAPNASDLLSLHPLDLLTLEMLLSVLVQLGIAAMHINNNTLYHLRPFYLNKRHLPRTDGLCASHGRNFRADVQPIRYSRMARIYFAICYLAPSTISTELVPTVLLLVAVCSYFITSEVRQGWTLSDPKEKCMRVPGQKLMNTNCKPHFGS